MQFLRTALWVIIALFLAFFCMANYVPVTVRLWGDLVMETKLPFLLIGAFLLGALPFWVMGRATRWRMKRRLNNAERALLAATTAATPPAPVLVEDDTSTSSPSLTPISQTGTL